MTGFVFQSRRHVPLLALVEQITGVPYSHCGLVQDGIVLESIATVQETPLDRWLAQGVDGYYALYSSGDKKTDKLAFSEARVWLGVGYDISFNLLNQQTCFCSKLLYYGLQQVGYWTRYPLELKRIKDYDLLAYWERIVAVYADFGIADVQPYFDNFTVSPGEIASRLHLVSTSFPPKPSPPKFSP